MWKRSENIETWDLRNSFKSWETTVLARSPLEMLCDRDRWRAVLRELKSSIKDSKCPKGKWRSRWVVCIVSKDWGLLIEGGKKWLKNHNVPQLQALVYRDAGGQNSLLWEGCRSYDLWSESLTCAGPTQAVVVILYLSFLHALPQVFYILFYFFSFL